MRGRTVGDVGGAAAAAARLRVMMGVDGSEWEGRGIVWFGKKEWKAFAK